MYDTPSFIGASLFDCLLCLPEYLLTCMHASAYLLLECGGTARTQRSSFDGSPFHRPSPAFHHGISDCILYVQEKERLAKAGQDEADGDAPAVAPSGTLPCCMHPHSSFVPAMCRCTSMQAKALAACTLTVCLYLPCAIPCVDV